MIKKFEDIKGSLKRSRGTTYELFSLTNLANKYKDVQDSELLEYVPVKIVSLFEEHFRQLYAEIIDMPKYRCNLKKVKFLKDLRMDFDVIDAFQNNEVTLGDYLSYYFSCNSVYQVMDQFGQLLNMDVKSKLMEKIVDIELKSSVSENDARKAASLYIESVDLIFKARHIMCHEGAFMNKLENPMVMQMIDDAILFAQFIDNIVSDILYPGFDYTQASMNNDAYVKFEKADNNLNQLIEYIKDNKKDLEPDFSYLESWKEFRKCKAESDAKTCEGGSMYPCIYYSSLEETTKQLLVQLKSSFRLYDYKVE
ncbi:hypothetical protein ONT15_12390 [Prevotella copri]|uniref:Uncharacterized protein n=1 Tax=Segatella copri TaxID=165179 RepID=A0AAW5U445_9BACT|nr:lysozyme inhibitor LprI family protein [Segatella copri]MCW4100187.1 hypothetical protein [Segatella copri]MCW4133028.1 hypothetical protein [Segatella copri]MCW4163583.1 hypothetical protein [Segatella copri]